MNQFLIAGVDHHTPDDFSVACDVTLYSNPVNRALGDAMVVKKTAAQTAKAKSDAAKNDTKEGAKEVTKINFKDFSF